MENAETNIIAEASKNKKKKRQMYFAAGLLLLWALIFLAVHFGVIKS